MLSCQLTTYDYLFDKFLDAGSFGLVRKEVFARLCKHIPQCLHVELLTYAVVEPKLAVESKLKFIAVCSKKQL